MLASPTQPRRAAAAAFIGTTIEWYDFYVYGAAAALVFGNLFFPSRDRIAGTMASFATFAVGFLARPLGAVLFGYVGDWIGRKEALLTTLILMGVATVAIGLLPTSSTVHFAAFLLIGLRFVQGIAVGGEWGGAVLIAAEHAPRGRRTFFASFAQLGSPAGLVLSMLAFQAVAALGNDALLRWGWRVPFLASGILLVVGFFVRVGLSEPPRSEGNRRRDRSRGHPLPVLLRSFKKPLALCIAANTVGIAGFYFTNTYMLAYATQNLGLERKAVLSSFLIVSLLQLVAQPVAAGLAERIGTGKFLKISAACAIASPYPMFVLVNSGNAALLTLGIAIAILCIASFYSAIAGFISGVFPADVRYSAISVSYQLCAAFIGGLTPLAASWIAHCLPDQWWPLAAFYSCLATLSLLGVVALDRARCNGLLAWDPS